MIVFVKFRKLKKSNIFSFSPLLMCGSTELLTVGVPAPPVKKTKPHLSSEALAKEKGFTEPYGR